MGKTTGFLEYRRALPLAIHPARRVLHWREFHEALGDAEIGHQAARCMNCGTPFCHAGELHDATATGCPIRNLIPVWNDLVYRNKWKEAYATLALTNNFPEFTSRVCPAPCESSCVLGINDDPVMIKEIEYQIIERAFLEGYITARIPRFRTGKKVAVVGSGPAGLACADQLNQAGHLVTVFERDDRLGGLLMYGIPNMKLDKGIVQRRIDLLEEEGIGFRTTVSIGAEISAEELLRDFDAIVVCCGAAKPRDLAIEGRSLNGIHFAMDFLTANTKYILDPSHMVEPINVKGQDVIVIGGGDTGTDCVATAIRQGCRSVVQFEILQRPPERTVDHDGWLGNVRTFQTDYGQEEAQTKFGCDPREFRVLTNRFLGDQKGNLKGLETVEIASKEDKQTPVRGSEKTWPAEAVLLAMGFTGPEKIAVFDELGIEMTGRGTIAVDENKRTSVEGIFAAGDCERGQSLVVWAIADGRKAAEGVNKFLSSKN